MRQLLRQYRSHGELGFVPTMGALHQGHLSLVERARRENNFVVVSIFVNPLQFGVNEDYDRYPRQLNHDLELCERAGVDVVFAPSAEVMGVTAPLLVQVVPDPSLTNVLCGKTRVGHFTGVATIVTKLLHIIQPDRLYLGEKDGQQLAILQRLVSDLNLPVEVVACPTVRDNHGLALSSRLHYLSPSQKQLAHQIYPALQQAEQAFRQGVRDGATLVAIVTDALAKYPEIQLEYVELVDSNSLQPLTEIGQGMLAVLAVAVHIGNTRLIDNVRLCARQPIIAIDGPAGAGKSTTAALVAKELGLLHLDTGAMYRAISLAVLEAGIDPQDEVAVAELASQVQIELLPVYPQVVLLNGRDVTEAIRSGSVTKIVSTIAAQPAVRQILWQYQRAWGCRGGIVAEGRDMGTRVFPDAELKIFLTASVKERALRRQKELASKGESVELASLEQAIRERDHRDSTRSIAPLRQAETAILLETDGLTIEEVVGQIVAFYSNLIQGGAGTTAATGSDR